MHVKRFLEWIGLKEKLDLSPAQVPLVHEGEIWWASLGENVGFEINGKSKLFTRPVLIYKKLTRGFYFVIPLTTQMKVGTWYVSLSLHGKGQVACLHQGRSIDARRLYSRLGRLDDMGLEKLRRAFRSLYH